MSEETYPINTKLTSTEAIVLVKALQDRVVQYGEQALPLHTTIIGKLGLADLDLALLCHWAFTTKLGQIPLEAADD